MTRTVIYRERVIEAAAREDARSLVQELPESFTSAPARDIVGGYARHKARRALAGERGAQAGEDEKNADLPSLSRWQIRSLPRNPTRAQLAGPQTPREAEEEAIAAFEDGRIIFFWNGAQITSPDEILSLKERNEAAFVYLVPLQGG